MKDISIFKKELVNYIKRNKPSYRNESFKKYSITQLVMIKTTIEVQKEKKSKFINEQHQDNNKY